MYTIAKYNPKFKPNLRECIKELFKNEDYHKSISEGTTDPPTIATRFRLAKEYLVQNGE